MPMAWEAGPPRRFLLLLLAALLMLCGAAHARLLNAGKPTFHSLSAPVEASGRRDMQADDSHAEYLDPHNAARAEVGSPPLTWNNELAARAQRWADHLATNNNCGLEHGDADGVGQNLAMSMGNPDYSSTDATNGWVSEKNNYQYQVFDLNVNAAGCKTGNWADCGHYTQVVWAKTTEVGCGMATCSGDTKVFACDYYPPGNMQGEFPYGEQNQPSNPEEPPPSNSGCSMSPPAH